MASKMFNVGQRVHVTENVATSGNPWEPGIYTVESGAGGIGKGGYKFFDLKKVSNNKTVPHVPAHAIEDYKEWCSSHPMKCAFAKGGKTMRGGVIFTATSPSTKKVLDEISKKTKKGGKKTKKTKKSRKSKKSRKPKKSRKSRK